jgi:mRNA interferase RelE/StbE
MFQEVSAIRPATPEGQQDAIPEILPPTEQTQPAEDWRFGFANSFRKAVDSIDRKLQGRILQALADIAVSPVTNRGDTIKPLSGDMNGYWRYRIGDFRLVYYPDEATHTVTLCDFASRGSVYD